MPDEKSNEMQPSWAKSLLSSIASSFNTNLHNSGIAFRNKFFVNYTVNIGSQSTKDVSAVIEEKKILYTEVIPNDQIIMKLIWTYLNIEDKINCTLVCKRFNNIISDMNCFRLSVDLSSKFLVFPRLSRDYETVIFKNYECKNLKEPKKKMLKQLNRCVEKTIFSDCKFDMMALNGFLSELSMLKSLELNMLLTIDDNIEIDFDDLPQLFQLEDLTINVNGDKTEEILNMFSCASNIQSLCLSLFNANIKHNVLYYMKRYKKMLKSLSFTRCIVDKAENLLNLNTLHLDSIKILQPKHYRSFDDLQNLRVLHLSKVDIDLLKILDTNCISCLTELKVDYSHFQRDLVNHLFAKYMYKIGFDKVEYQTSKKSCILNNMHKPDFSTMKQQITYEKTKENNYPSVYVEYFVENKDKNWVYCGFYNDTDISVKEQFNKSEHKKKCFTDFSDKSIFQFTYEKNKHQLNIVFFFENK